jgi:deazaflavin-dependent oxidoreductase (nitroreductase family)
MNTPQFTPAQMNQLRNAFRVLNKFMVFMWKIGLGRFLNIWPSVGGRIMIIKHVGRKSGQVRLVPVNYAVVTDEIYCTAGFGSSSDWYRNIVANPQVELWLPGKKIQARAEDVSDAPQRAAWLRAVIIASGVVGPLFGVNPKKLDDQALLEITKDYRLIHFIKEH